MRPCRCSPLRHAPRRCWFALIVLALAGAPALAGDTHLWRSIPGTRTPDYGGPLLIERDGVIYQAIPGTRTPDYGARERWIIRDDTVYDAIPGTRTPNYGTGRQVIRGEDR